MRVLRAIGAVVVWLLATVALILGGLLCGTVLLLPVGVPLVALGLRLYAYGVQLMLPRAKEVKRGMRKGLGLRPHGSAEGDLKRANGPGRKSGWRLRKKAGGVAHDAGKAAHRGRKQLAGASHHAGDAMRG